MLDKSLTIVLPIHNGEARLRACVDEILELASELTTRYQVLIIDDGSTDTTYEVAEEMASLYPQVSVLRRRHRRGLGPIIEYAERHIRSDAVIVHDGVTPIDPNQVRTLWRNCLGQSSVATNTTPTAAAMQSAICDFANLPAIHAAMEQVHNRVLGFQWIAPQAGERIKEASAQAQLANAPRTDAPHARRANGMGQIPRLPRPKFLSVLAEFAFGE